MRRVLACEALRQLFDALARRGYSIVGPTIRDGAIVHEEIASPDQLPVGWTDDQAPGRYRLRPRDDRARFGFAAAPDGWKRLMSPPLARLWRARRDDGRLVLEPERTPPPRLALVGVRACDLAALAILDRVYDQAPDIDTGYGDRRTACFIVAVNCVEAGGTCFCASMGTGPAATSGFDLALTELLDEGRHELLVEAGSDDGAALLGEIDGREASADDVDRAARATARAAAGMGRRLETDGLHDLLYASLDHPEWDEVAARCLTCGNCTASCPTCFCTTTEDRIDLAGVAERWTCWDSCFSREFSYIHGGFVRASGRSRYRQWMTHKLASWIDQFGTTGCVGCGRCLTWCPAGIDITEEARVMRGRAAAPRHGPAR